MKELTLSDECINQFNEFVLTKIKSNELNFKDLTDKYKNLHIGYGNSGLYGFLLDNTELLRLLIENSIVSFQEIVDKYKNIQNKNHGSCIYNLLKNIKLFEELIENNKLTRDDLKHLLNNIDYWDELRMLLNRNISLLKHILNEFILDKETVNDFNEMLKKYGWDSIFEFIEYWSTHEWDKGVEARIEIDEEFIDKELLNLNELNKCIYTFDLTKEQKLEMTELIKNNKIAQNRLIQIVDNQLESQYDFDSLMKYLKKKEKKNLINI